ncbi:hypothetical protein DSECCO2_595500 [anaerobic digester metagenome]
MTTDAPLSSAPACQRVRKPARASPVCNAASSKNQPDRHRNDRCCQPRTAVRHNTRTSGGVTRLMAKATSPVALVLPRRVDWKKTSRKASQIAVMAGSGGSAIWSASPRQKSSHSARSGLDGIFSTSVSAKRSSQEKTASAAASNISEKALSTSCIKSGASAETQRAMRLSPTSSQTRCARLTKRLPGKRLRSRRQTTASTASSSTRPTPKRIVEDRARWLSVPLRIEAVMEPLERSHSSAWSGRPSQVLTAKISAEGVK